MASLRRLFACHADAWPRTEISSAASSSAHPADASRAANSPHTARVRARLDAAAALALSPPFSFSRDDHAHLPRRSLASLARTSACSHAVSWLRAEHPRLSAIATADPRRVRVGEVLLVPEQLVQFVQIRPRAVAAFATVGQDKLLHAYAYGRSPQNLGAEPPQHPVPLKHYLQPGHLGRREDLVVREQVREDEVGALAVQAVHRHRPDREVVEAEMQREQE